jgi:hypothetical protein
MPKNQKITQAIVTTRDKIKRHKTVENFALFAEDGTPIDLHPQTGANLVHETITTDTAIGTAAKTTTSEAPLAGTLVAIKFTNGNSANSPTVAFDGGAAKPILLGGTPSTGAKCAIAANGIGVFLYDGTSLHQVGAYT